MTADERIQKLLERAGCPGMIALNTQEDASTRYEDMRSCILNTCDKDYDGSMIAYVKHLADIIDQLEGALEYVIGERDALLKRISNIASCRDCKYDSLHSNEDPCNRCLHGSEAGKPCWVWRGVPDQEGGVRA